MTPTVGDAVADRLRFNRLVKVVLKHEGGYVNDADDPGGETNFGISKRSYPHLDIKGLTEKQAMDIYYKDWWLPLHLNEIEDDAVAVKVLDLCVNVGKRTGVKLFQQALKARGHNVAVNGIMGKPTIEAANRAHAGRLLDAIRGRQADHYLALISINPALAKYKTGWLKRAYS